jgi:FHS family L-fucose permease-like MFS transporter
MLPARSQALYLSQNTMSKDNQSLFKTNDGKNYLYPFLLVTSLFFIWAVCNGMIDTMDKHFQEELHLNKSQSAWVQFAHYLGYFLMSLPAGWLARKLGYKGGIMAGLIVVALGGFWFIPATHINAAAQAGTVSLTTAFVGYLVGVCAIATGLTFLETVANPYTTVLGPPAYAASRINFAQSANGVGWVVGPQIGAVFFYSKDALGHNTGSETLYIPYVTIAIICAVLAVVFYFSYLPDIKNEDDYHLDENDAGAALVGAERELNRGLIYSLMVMNAAVFIGACGVIVWAILGTLNLDPGVINWILWGGGTLTLIIAAIRLRLTANKVTAQSIWSHPHFSSATVAQFFYVAAQACIFTFFINYMTAEIPAIPASVKSIIPASFLDSNASGLLGLSDRGAASLSSLAFMFFLAGRISGSFIMKSFSAHKVLGLYSILNVAICALIFLKLGWLSVFCVFLSYFFMSIMFPTIFALGLHGLGAKTKKASAFIVMAIMGGAILPKLMGHVADKYDMSRGFIVPLFCFIIVALYAFNWPKFADAESLDGVKISGGH